MDAGALPRCRLHDQQMKRIPILNINLLPLASLRQELVHSFQYRVS